MKSHTPQMKERKAFRNTSTLQGDQHVISLLKVGETKTGQALKPRCSTTESGQLSVLLTAPLLLALPSIRWSSKAAQVLGLNTVQVQYTPAAGNCAWQAGSSCAEALDHFQGHSPYLCRSPATTYQVTPRSPNSNRTRREVRHEFPGKH